LILLIFMLFTGCNVQEETVSGLVPQSTDEDGTSSQNSATDTTTAPVKIAVGSQPINTEKQGFFRNLVRNGPPVGITSSQCTEITEGGPVNGPGCITSEIRCGETIVGHTRGGVNKFNSEWYDESTCWPNTRNHNGGDERLYRFDPDANGIPARFWANFWFDTPCDKDVDFTVFRTTDRSNCPTEFTPNCDTSNPNTKANRTRRHQRVMVDPGEVWYVLIEGANETEGPFAVTLTCELGQ